MATITERAENEIRNESHEANAEEFTAAVAPEFAALKYRTSEDEINEIVKKHVGTFDNNFVVFGNMSPQDRSIYLAKHRKSRALHAALNGITRDELAMEPEAEALIFAQTTMGVGGFTTKEMNTSRAFDQYVGGPRPQPGFMSRLIGRGKMPLPEEAPPP